LVLNSYPGGMLKISWTLLEDYENLVIRCVFVWDTQIALIHNGNRAPSDSVVHPLYHNLIIFTITKTIITINRSHKNCKMDKDSDLSSDSGDERPRKSAYKKATKPAPKTRATLLRRGNNRPKKRSKSKVSTLDHYRRMNALDKPDIDPEYTEEEEERETGKKKRQNSQKRTSQSMP
jgi:hypothetical protein